MFTGSSKFTAVLQAVLIVCLLNGLFIYIYTKSGYANTITPSECVQTFHENSITTTQLSLTEMQTKIIYYKTHKTASTTVGNIIFRFGAQHGLKLHDPHSHYYYIGEGSAPEEVDISLFHHKPTDFEVMAVHYKSFIPQGKFISILREPVRRYLSHYHYYNAPINHTFDAYLTWTDYNNIMSRDFGIFNKTQMDKFMADYYSQFFYLITEKFDEGLLMLKNAWHWNLEDILYVRLNDGCSVGFRNYDKRPMYCQPAPNNLTEQELTLMRQNNQLDIELYERALRDFNAKLDAQPKSFWDELKVFRKMQRELNERCTHNTSAIALCEPYLWADMNYEAKISLDGRIHNFTRTRVSYPTTL